MAKMPFKAKDGIVTPRIGVSTEPTDIDKIAVQADLTSDTGSAAVLEDTQGHNHGNDTALVKLLARGGVDANKNMVSGYGNAGAGVGNSVRTFNLRGDGAIETRGTMKVSPGGRDMFEVKDGQIEMLSGNTYGGFRIRTDAASGYNGVVKFESVTVPGSGTAHQLFDFTTAGSIGHTKIDVNVQNNLHAGDGITIGTTGINEAEALHIAHDGGIRVQNQAKTYDTFTVSGQGGAYLRDNTSIGASTNTAYRLNVQERHTLTNIGSEASTIRAYADINGSSFLSNTNNAYSVYKAVIKNRDASALDPSRSYLLRGFVQTNASSAMTNVMNIDSVGNISTIGTITIDGNEIYHPGNQPSVDVIGAAKAIAPVFNTSTHGHPVSFARNSSIAEALQISVGDTDARIWYNNDETASTMSFRINNTGAEGGNQANANIHTLEFKGNVSTASLEIDGHKVFHEANRPTPSDINAYPITGGAVSGLMQSDTGNMISRAPENGHAQFWLRRHDSSHAGLLWWDHTNNNVGIRKYSATGDSIECQLILESNRVRVTSPVVQEGTQSTDSNAYTLKSYVDSFAYTKTQADEKYIHRNQDIHIAKVANVDSVIKLSEASAVHGISLYYDADSNVGELIGRESNVDRPVVRWHRNASYFNVVTGVLQEQGQRVYSPNHKPAIGDVTSLQTTLDSIHTDIASAKSVADANTTSKLDKTAKAVDSALLNGHSDFYSPRNKPSIAQIGGLPSTAVDMEAGVTSSSSIRYLGDVQGSAHQRLEFVDSASGYFGFNLALSGDTGSSWRNVFEVKTKNSTGTENATILKAFGRNIYWEGNKPSASDVGAITQTIADGRYVKKGEAAGSATTANRLTSPRTITLTGDATGSLTFDGSANVSMATVVHNDSHVHTHGTVQGASINEGGLLRLILPKGAAYSSPSGSVTGALKITLPNGKTNTMMTLKISLYDYAMNESFELRVAGYNHTSGWINTSATILSTKSDRQFKVRFGYDGAKCCILIGETTSVWAHPKLAVTEGTFGYSSFEETRWDDGWNIGVVQTLPTIDKTHVTTFPYASGAEKLTHARTITLNGDLTGSASFDGSSNISISAAVKNDSHTHSTYALKTDKAPDANLFDGINSDRFVYGTNGFACTKTTDFNTNRKSGFIESNKASNQPGTASSWTWGWQTSHVGNGSSAKYGAQSVVSQDGHMYFRVQNSSGSGTWRQVLRYDVADGRYYKKTDTVANADKLDNLNSTQFVRSDASTTISSGKYINFTPNSGIKRTNGTGSKNVLYVRDYVELNAGDSSKDVLLGWNDTHVIRINRNLTASNGTTVIADASGNTFDAGTRLTTKYAYKAGTATQDFAMKHAAVESVTATETVKAKKMVIDETVEIRKNTDGSIGFYL